MKLFLFYIKAVCYHVRGWKSVDWLAFACCTIIALHGHWIAALALGYLFAVARVNPLRWFISQRLWTNNPVIKGDTTVLWGTSEGTTLTGIIVSVRDTLTGEMVEVPDENGYTVAAIFFNDKNEGELEMIVKTSYPELARGDEVTIMGVDGYLVQDYVKVWEQKGVRKYNLKATRFSGLDLGS